jgi:hypothetical protein
VISASPVAAGLTKLDEPAITASPAGPRRGPGVRPGLKARLDHQGDDDDVAGGVRSGGAACYVEADIGWRGLRAIGLLPFGTGDAEPDQEAAGRQIHPTVFRGQHHQSRSDREIEDRSDRDLAPADSVSDPAPDQRAERCADARGVFRSVADLQTVHAYLAEHNASPEPFVWAKSAETILAKLDRCPVPSV